MTAKKRLQAFSPQAAALFSLSANDIDAIRGACAARDLIPYDMLNVCPKVPSRSFKSKINSILTDGWNHDQVRTDLRAPIGWDGHCRSYRFHMHAWEPLTYLLPGYEFFNEERCLGTSVLIADDWLRLFQVHSFSEDLMLGVQTALGREDTMAWNDMAVGQRCYRLAYLTDVAARSPGYEATFERLFRALVFHMEVLSVDAFWASHSNHGLYQAVGQMAAARRFLHLSGFDLYFERASVRFAQTVKGQFCNDGLHREHSPGYHWMVFGTVSGALRGGLIENPEVAGILKRAHEALAWMVTPDGSLATFGDTDYNCSYFIYRSAPEVATGDETDLTGWPSGEEPAPPIGVRAYLEAGYAFARFRHDGCSRSEDAYLAQIAGFHSRVHKHADHLSFVWNDCGTRILIDPGRYAYGEKAVWGDEDSKMGFFYSDRKRIYVERTRAHNCVEVDGRDYLRRRVMPFGSALQLAAEVDGMAITFCEARHVARHCRTLILGPGKFLLVLDWLGYKDGPERDFKQWFQLAPSWRASAETSRLVASDGVRHLVVESLVAGPELSRIHHGELDPMQGWMSPGASKLTPTPSFCFSATGAAVRFATLFSLSNDLEIEDVTLNNTLTAGRLKWFGDGETHDVSFRRKDDLFEATWQAVSKDQ